MRSITRLVVGGLLVGAESLRNQLDEWETDWERNDESGSPQIPPSIPEDIVELSDKLDPTILQSGESPLPTSRIETQADLYRFGAIGMMFTLEERVVRWLKTVDRLSRIVGKTTEPFIKPIIKSGLFAPIKSQFDEFVDRGESEVAQWIELGRVEELHSRQLADIALYNTVDFWIDYFAENPEVVDLVTTQSVSFAGEIVEEVRERTVSADNLLEGFVRLIFRKPSRADLPAPPPEIQKEAQYTRKQL